MNWSWREWLEGNLVLLDGRSRIKSYSSAIGQESPPIGQDTWAFQNVQNKQQRGTDASDETDMTLGTTSVPANEHDQNTSTSHLVSEMVILSVAEAEHDKCRDDVPTFSDTESLQSSRENNKHAAEAAPPKDRMNRTRFEKGQMVKAQYFNGFWYPAKISEIKGDGLFYVVDWEDEDTRDRLKCVDEV
jgi:hypothetical protein